MRLAKTVTGAVALTLLSTAAFSQQARVYKWVDETGTTHFTDRPPNNATVQETNVRYRRTDKAAVQASLNRQAELNQVAQTRLDQQAEEASEAEAQRRESQAQRAKLCQQARDRVKRYETAHRLYRPMPDGEREYLSDAELDSERADARRAISEWCD